MVNDRRGYADTFWFTLFHEIGHIMNGDYGITLKGHNTEDEADIYAQNKLIPQEQYDMFVEKYNNFNESVIRRFADSIGRDPGIVYGRLQNDGKIPYSESIISSKLRKKYKVLTN